MAPNKELPLPRVQELLKKAHIDGLLIRSTDRYFNEYVPEYLSARANLSGFNGSVGDALITTDAAFLFVDGRYGLQAKNQAHGFAIDICGSHSSIEQRWLAIISEHFKKGQTLAYDPETLNSSLFDRLSQTCESAGIKLVATGNSLIAESMKNIKRPEPRDIKVWMLPPADTSQSTKDKIEALKNELLRNNVKAFLCVKLDDIAWLLNIRSNFFPFQLTVPALAAITKEEVYISPALGLKLPDLGPLVKILPEEQLLLSLKDSCGPNLVVGIDEHETSKAHEMALQALNISIKRIANPIAPLKAIKNAKELLILRNSFKKADKVVNQTQIFVVKSYEAGHQLSEGDVDDHIKRQFFSSGAEELSFRPICAGGKNGAIIHYGTPSREEKVVPGSLFLLDTGAFYQGYATDLTRTFLAGSESDAKNWQKEMFTLVLKASIKGLSARFRRGTLGMQLDAIVRAPLWQASMDYAHGTGHGIGINVHEFPPRIGPTSNSVLKEGQVFSIEPGIYVEGLGGVRIENLATIVEDPKDENFLCILPLTFCPLDKRLIENSMLDAYDHEFLRYFEAEWHNDAPMPNLPPARRASFAIEK